MIMSFCPVFLLQWQPVLQNYEFIEKKPYKYTDSEWDMILGVYSAYLSCIWKPEGKCNGEALKDSGYKIVRDSLPLMCYSTCKQAIQDAWLHPAVLLSIHSCNVPCSINDSSMTHVLHRRLHVTPHIWQVHCICTGQWRFICETIWWGNSTGLLFKFRFAMSFSSC